MRLSIRGNKKSRGADRGRGRTVVAKEFEKENVKSVPESRKLSPIADKEEQDGSQFSPQDEFEQEHTQSMKSGSKFKFLKKNKKRRYSKPIVNQKLDWSHVQSKTMSHLNTPTRVERERKRKLMKEKVSFSTYAYLIYSNAYFGQHR